MPVAAILITLSLSRSQPWLAAKKKLLWSAHLIWISILLLIVTMTVFIVTLHRAGGHMGPHMTQLPAGVIALDGWANRMYVLCSCWWIYAVAKQVHEPGRIQPELQLLAERSFPRPEMIGQSGSDYRHRR